MEMVLEGAFYTVHSRNPSQVKFRQALAKVFSTYIFWRITAYQQDSIDAWHQLLPKWAEAPSNTKPP